MSQFNCKLISQAKKTKGYLTKKSNGMFSSWKRRYFIVIEDHLSYFQDQTLSTHKNNIKFIQMIHIKPINKLDFEIKTKKKSYLLRTSTTEEQDLWVASLNIMKQSLLQKIKNISKTNSNSKPKNHKNLKQSFNSSEQQSQKNTSRTNQSIKKHQTIEKIIPLFKQKQINRFFTLFQLDNLSEMAKDQKIFKRILYFQDKSVGTYFAVCSKSIHPTIDDQLLKQDIIYPYQLNVLYFVPIQLYQNGVDKKEKYKVTLFKLTQICKLNELLECSLNNKSAIKLQIHCQKPLEIQLKHLSEQSIFYLSECIKKAMKVGKEYWNPKGKLLKNIDFFLEKYYNSSQNQLVLHKLVEAQFQKALSINKFSSLNSEEREPSDFFTQFDSIISNLKNFNDACEIKDPPLFHIRQNFVKFYHKFVYNYLSKNWGKLFKKISNDELISYANKVYVYYQIIQPFYNDNRIKQGCKTLLRIALNNFISSINQLITNFNNIDEESLRILKKTQFENENRQIIYQQIFFNTFCTNFMSIFVVQFKQISQLIKNDELIILGWSKMKHIFKIIFQKLVLLSQECKDRSSLISICNTLNFIKKKKIPQLFSELQKTPFFSMKKEKQQFLKDITYEITQIQIFCVKKLFIITFSSIDRDLLKNQIKNIDFQKICSIVIDEITKLNNLFPEVRIAMYEAAFQQVCYFFYICVAKFDNKTLTKDDCISMITQKLTIIRDQFYQKVDKQKIMQLLKDLNLLKLFITSPINLIKNITRDLKKTFGSNFTQLNLKNLISLRTNISKQKQFLFEECREQIKSSYNSNQQIQSFQRESFFNSSYRRQRKSTLTQSLQSYCDHIEKCDKKKNKFEKNFNFRFQNFIKQGYIYRKKVIKNINTSFSRYFYRLTKGRLYQYDSDDSEDHLNLYALNQLKKCYIQPQKNDCIHLEFEKETLKLKTSDSEQISQWIQKILQAIQQQKTLIGEFNQNQIEQGGVLFEDFSNKKTLQTKQTQQISSPFAKNSLRKNNKPSLSPVNSKKTPNKINNPQLRLSKSKQRYRQKQVNRQNISLKKSQKSKKSSQKGCGAGCNFL